VRIKSIETAVLEIPLDSPIGDSQIRIDKWGVVVVRIFTDEEIVGFGYNSNIGLGGRALKTLIDEDISPRVRGKDVFLVKRIWEEVYLQSHFTGVTGVAVQGVAAVEVAMWDAIAKRLGQPLWKLLGGYEPVRLATYNTDAGWLSLSLAQMVNKVKKLVDEGWRGVKIKVGSPDPWEDYERVKAVREAIGPRVLLMVDANNKWDLPTAVAWTSRLEEFGVFWMEEPLHPFDVKGHAVLSSSVRTPILAGENIYSLHMFRDFFEQKALRIAQADVLKLGGITTWLEVAALAHAYSIPIVPAAWDMMQLDVQLCAAIPHALMVEYIPWILKIFERPVKFSEGYLLVPQEPGAGVDIKPEALEEFRVA
jgi:L-alanine-DL-glutamate epimerase-like enolase superfamily enzyme